MLLRKLGRNTISFNKEILSSLTNVIEYNMFQHCVSDMFVHYSILASIWRNLQDEGRSMYELWANDLECHHIIQHPLYEFHPRLKGRRRRCWKRTGKYTTAEIDRDVLTIENGVSQIYVFLSID